MTKQWKTRMWLKVHQTFSVLTVVAASGVNNNLVMQDVFLGGGLDGTPDGTWSSLLH
jgi:hypothetical protein